MSTGVLTKVQHKTYGGGKPMVIAEWDNGDKGVTFANSKSIGAFEHLAEGDSTEYSLKPGADPGKDPLITFIKKAVMGGNGGGNGGTAPAAPKRNYSESETDKQLSIFLGYSKDLVTAGVVKPTTASIAATVDLVASMAVALHDRFNAMKKSVKAEAEGAGNGAAPVPANPQ